MESNIPNPSVTKKPIGVSFTPELLSQLNQVRQDHPECKTFSAVVRFVLSQAFSQEGGTHE